VCVPVSVSRQPENILLVSNEYDWVKFPRGPGTTKRPRRADIKIIDFGSATFADEYHCSVINTRQYRAPEVILDIGWSMASDVWSLGCILMEVYSGALLFKTHEHLEHLAMIEKIIGPIPQCMTQAAATTGGRKYVNSLERRLDWPDGASSANSIRRVNGCLPLEEMVHPAHVGFAQFIRHLLQPDPASRPYPEEALRHVFLSQRFPEEL